MSLPTALVEKRGGRAQVRNETGLVMNLNSVSNLPSLSGSFRYDFTISMNLMKRVKIGNEREREGACFNAYRRRIWMIMWYPFIFLTDPLSAPVAPPGREH